MSSVAMSTADIDSGEMDLLDELVLTARQNGEAYRARDAGQAVQEASRLIRDCKADQLRGALSFIAHLAREELRRQWKEEA